MKELTSMERTVARRGSTNIMRKKVLIVDDNWMNLKVMEGLLERYQMKVSTAVNGPEALEKIQSKEFDFVFMNFMI